MAVVLGCLADDGLSDEAHRQIGQEFMKDNRDFQYTEDVFCRLMEYLVEHNLAFITENLNTAWNKIKANVSSRAQQLAVRQIELETQQADERNFLEDFSTEEVNETLSAIRRARANREI